MHRTTAGILVTQLAPTTIRGEALGVDSALMALAGGVGSIIGGRLALIGYPVAFLAAGVLILAGAVVVLVVSRGARTETSTPSAQQLG